MNSRLETAFSVFHTSKNKGFSLAEVLCAFVILALVIFSVFAVLNYTLRITVASRGRMDAFAAAERAAVTSLALKEGVSNPRVNSSRTPINGTLLINGVNQSIAMEAFAYKEGGKSAMPDQLMGHIAFVTFLKKAAP
jgi:Tfp pilus assembly protein PilV